MNSSSQWHIIPFLSQQITTKSLHKNKYIHEMRYTTRNVFKKKTWAWKKCLEFNETNLSQHTFFCWFAIRSFFDSQKHTYKRQRKEHTNLDVFSRFLFNFIGTLLELTWRHKIRRFLLTLEKCERRKSIKKNHPARLEFIRLEACYLFTLKQYQFNFSVQCTDTHSHLQENFCNLKSNKHKNKKKSSERGKYKNPEDAKLYYNTTYTNNHVYILHTLPNTFSRI